MKKHIVYIFLIFSTFSCIEEFDLELDKVKPRLVIDGLIEDSAGPHYIRLTKSATGTFIKQDSDTRQDNPDKDLELVEDATVIVSDDTGQIDTLKLVPKNSDDPIIYNKGGFYKTTNFIGVSGHTYFLKVITKEGKVFTASDYMSSVPKIDSISSQKRINEIKGNEYYVPILSFNEPESIGDYYLIRNYPFKPDRTRYYSIVSWDSEVLSDKNLKPGYVSIFLDNGASPRDLESYTYTVNSDIHVKMSSLSIKAYDYYKFLLGQFEQDGGAYKPAPASPPTNISNGGLGFFQASASVYAKTIVKENSKTKKLKTKSEAGG